jgi:hypothetical protein
MNSADLFRTEFQESIDVAFIETRLATSRGRVLAPLEPFGLRTPIQEAAEGVVLKLDPYAEWLPSHTLLYFYWDSFGPVSFDATIALVDLGVTGTLAYYITEYAPPYAFALIQPGGDTDIWPAFVVNLFRDNGESYGIELFGGLPCETFNGRPDLVSPVALREAFWQWIVGREAVGRPQWGDLRDQMIESLEQPNPLQRSSDLLQRVARLGIDGFLAATEPEHVDLPEDDRRRILENYFTLTNQW